MSETSLPDGQVCPNPDCNIDQRFKGFRGYACPECAALLVVACSKCDSGAIEEHDGTPFCSEHIPKMDADGDTGKTDIDKEAVQLQLQQILKTVGQSDLDSFSTTIVEQNCLGVWKEAGGIKLDEIRPNQSDNADNMDGINNE